ncbi:general stress protein [Niallia sp. 03133]|uniref:general stress protein n=1 Tax=Niallia sp. 03133 TaxID=3458060 RepID=UPI004044B5AD
MTKSIIGIYETPTETIAAIQRLMNKGYDSGDLSVITNRSDTDYLESQTGTNVSRGNDESFFEKLKDFFTIDDLGMASNKLSHLDVPDNDLDEYTEKLNAGKFLLAMDTKDLDCMEKESEQTGEATIGKKTTNQKVYIDAPGKHNDIYLEGSSGDKGTKLR